MFGQLRKIGTALKLYAIWRSIDMRKMKSKKFWVTIGAGVASLVLKELGVQEDHIQYLVGLAIAYVLGQGIADHGKEAEKVKAAAAKE